MEIHSSPPNKIKPWIIYLIIIYIISAFIMSVYFDYKRGQEKDAMLNQTQLSLNKELLDKTLSIHIRDSLIRENNRLSLYKALTKAMIYRDEATALLKYQVGDIAYLKRDSTRVIIQDIIIGGSKYNYYIKYVVLFKDNSWEQIDPLLIY